ncbi:hypothetical protein DH2020_004308 [Rehmannia glutinosa]|uniref:Uncharacterized protein n=1 Tax=Rehmannia glutinosa TaxID=99300 RepID=A0ABR0XP49_REHGL
MKKLRWAMDGGFWEVDVSTPVTVDGVARPVQGEPLPLGLSRGPRLSRPKQIDFFQRFMAMPFVPSFSNGLSFQRVLSLPLPSFARDTWFLTLLGQFNVQKFVTSLRRNGLRQESLASSLQSIWGHLSDPNLYALNFCSEWLFTPEDTLQLSLKHMVMTGPLEKGSISSQGKRFPNHNLTVEATSLALFVDRFGKYWDVPFTLAVDLASLASDSGTSCHFCINHTAGSPKQCKDQPVSPVPPSLLPGLCAKCAFSFKKNFDHGNFQKLFLDLTRFYARIDIPSGSKFLFGASQVAFDLCNSQVPNVEAFQAICPTANLSFQQQIAGPFSFRIDAGVTLDLTKDCYFNVNDPVFAVEYALQVLGSAKAVAWYSPRQREFMLELRFFET